MAIMPPRTRGPLGSRDAGDPDVLAETGDTPGALGVRDGAAHLVHGRTPQHARRPISLAAGATYSILDIPPGHPYSTYPGTLTVPDFLIDVLRELHRDDRVSSGGREVVIERAGIISKTGVLFALNKELHLRTLGEGNRDRGVVPAETTSPNVEKTLEALQTQERDPTVLWGAIYVHTHPGFSAPSPADIYWAAHHFRSVFTPSKSLVVGGKYMFLMIPTHETWSMNPSDIMPLVYNTQSDNPADRHAKDVSDLERGSIGNATAQVRAVHMQIYEYADTDKLFHRR
jgi:hypothetical protein